MPLQTNSTCQPMSENIPSKNEYTNTICVVGKFTDWIPFESKIVEELMTIQQVFLFFNPTIVVQLGSEEGTIYKEAIRFKRVSHFGKKGVFSQIPLLNKQRIQKEEYQNIIFQLETNEFFKWFFNDASDKQHFLNALRALYQIVNEADCMFSTETVFLTHENVDIEGSIDCEPMLRSAIEGLKRFDGYNLIESTSISGIKNLSPSRNEARKKMFLEEHADMDQRQNFKRRLQAWIDALESNGGIIEVIERSKIKIATVEKLLDKNLKRVFLQTSEMEKAYRLLTLVFRYDLNDAAKHVSFINADPSQLGGKCIMDIIQSEFLQDRNKINSLSCDQLLVVPSYPGSNEEVQRWKDFARDNDVYLIIDDEGGLTPDEVMEKIETELEKWQQKQ
jgi:hypothetical protein